MYRVPTEAICVATYVKAMRRLYPDCGVQAFHNARFQNIGMPGRGIRREPPPYDSHLTFWQKSRNLSFRNILRLAIQNPVNRGKDDEEEGR